MHVFTAAIAAAITADRQREADAARVVASARRARRHADSQVDQDPPVQARTAVRAFDPCDTFVLRVPAGQ
jgi:hypothetical protein